MKKLLLPLSIVIIILVSNFSLHATNTLDLTKSHHNELISGPGDTIFVSIGSFDADEINRIKNDLVAENFVWIGYCQSLGTMCVKTPPAVSDPSFFFEDVIKKTVARRYVIYPAINENYNTTDPCFYQ